MNVFDLLSVNTPPLELVLRASLMYWFLLLMFRFVLRREPGSTGRGRHFVYRYSC